MERRGNYMENESSSLIFDTASLNSSGASSQILYSSCEGRLFEERVVGHAKMALTYQLKITLILAT